MATVLLSELLRELFTKKTCIYLPHTHETVNENCVVWETKYCFRKEVYSSRGKLKLESTPINENTDVKEEISQCNDFRQNPEIEKLRPVLKQKENEYMKESRMRAIMKSKMGKNSLGRSNGQDNVKNSKFSDKSKILNGSATRKNYRKMNADRNNANRNGSVNMKKYSDKNQTRVEQFSNVDHMNTSGRKVSELNAKDATNKDLKHSVATSGRNVSELNAKNATNKYIKTGITNLDKGAGRKEDADAINYDRNSKTTNNSRMTGGQLSQSENINARNRTGNVDAVGDAGRVDGASHAQNNNLNQISGFNHSEATPKISFQHMDQNQNKNAGAAFGGSTNSKSLLHLSPSSYDSDQTGTADTVRNKYGIHLPSEYGVRSSFPSKCNKTNLVYDERQKTQNFGSQCTENSFFQDDNTDPCLDNKTASKSAKTECGCGISVLIITTGRQN